MLKQKFEWNFIPFPIRFSLLHFMIMVLIINQFPPVSQLPHVILPFTWGGALAITIMIYGFFIPTYQFIKSMYFS